MSSSRRGVTHPDIFRQSSTRKRVVFGLPSHAILCISKFVVSEKWQGRDGGGKERSDYLLFVGEELPRLLLLCFVVTSCTVVGWEVHMCDCFMTMAARLEGWCFLGRGDFLGAAGLLRIVIDDPFFWAWGLFLLFFQPRPEDGSLSRIITLFRLDYPALHRWFFSLCSVGSARWELRFKMNQPICGNNVSSAAYAVG